MKIYQTSNCDGYGAEFRLTFYIKIGGGFSTWYSKYDHVNNGCFYEEKYRTTFLYNDEE